MNNPIPGKPGIINDDMDLAIPELSRLLHQVRDVVRIRDIADDGQSAAGLGGVDGVCDGVGFFCWPLASVLSQ